jgi:hypothetical protein
MVVGVRVIPASVNQTGETEYTAVLGGILLE